jgi:molybdopterin-guanine dinucleotide biosynthesis protein A
VTHAGGGVLLTGGSSRRMGFDKAALVVDGETLAARGARVLRAVFGEACVEVGPGASGLPSTLEEPPGAGPLAALVAGAGALAARGHEGAVVLLGCDLPFADAALVQLLARWPGEGSAIPVLDGHFQYACARYGPDAIRHAHDAVAAGRSALRELAAVPGTDTVAEHVWRRVAPAHALADVDTADDLSRFGITLPR